MKILAIADSKDLTWAGSTQPVDIVLGCGDLCDTLILSAARACSALFVFAVKGNHDGDGPFPPPIVDLHLQVVTLPNGFRIGGFNGCWRYKPKGAFLYDQGDADILLRQLPAVDLLITHNSPAGIHEAGTRTHQGFTGLIEYIRRHSPKLLLHGHQHINRGTTLGTTRVVGVYGSVVFEL